MDTRRCRHPRGVAHRLVPGASVVARAGPPLRCRHARHPPGDTLRLLLMEATWLADRQRPPARHGGVRMLRNPAGTFRLR
jgi:hypothetical protein